jgi:hypothetical protein
MKLNGTIANRKVHRDTIPGIEIFGNLKLQAPNSNDSNYNIQHAAQAPALRVTKTGLEF